MRHTKRKGVALIGILLCLFLSTTSVYAGSINGAEAGLLGQASGTFYYQGKSYVATSGSLGQLRAYLSRDDIDLTAAQASSAASSMYGNVANGVAQGYIVPVGGSSDKDSGSTDKKTNQAKTKKNREKAGKATVQVVDRQSVFKVTNTDGKEVFKASTPVKNTGFSLTGLFVAAGILIIITLAGIILAWKSRIFAHSHGN